MDDLADGRVGHSVLRNNLVTTRGQAYTSTKPGGKGMIRFATMRSEEQTSELQSLMRSSYAVFCLKKKHKLKHISYNDLCCSFFFLSSRRRTESIRTYTPFP